MSPNETLVLRYAYENYLKTGNYYFVYRCKDSEEWLRVISGIHYLYEYGFIDEVPEIVKRGHGSSPLFFSVDGNITDSGIEKARSEWELKG